MCVLYLLYYRINVHIQNKYCLTISLTLLNHERVRVPSYQLADVTFSHIRLLSRKSSRLIMRVMRWFSVSFGFTLSLIGWFLINSGFGFYKKLMNKHFQLLTKRWVALEVSKCLSLELQACLCSDIRAVHYKCEYTHEYYVFSEYRVFINEWLFIGNFYSEICFKLVCCSYWHTRWNYIHVDSAESITACLYDAFACHICVI